VEFSFVEAAFACILQGDALTGIDLIDARYFYFDKSQGDATSLIARMALADSLRLFCDNSHFLNASWYDQLGMMGNNPSVLGFIVKHMLLSAICAFGCPLASAGLKHDLFPGSAPITRYPEDFPVLKAPGSNLEDATHLFVPASHKCRYIDGILVRWNFDAKSVAIAPMQITLATSHAPSDALFMENHWRGMVARLKEWDIYARFLWIKEKRKGSPEVTTVPAKESPDTRGAGATLLHPAYDVVTLTVTEVSGSIGDKLRHARALSAAAAKL
jgi:hypothetical protein